MAMKVVKSAEHYTETALDEIKLLKSVSVFSLLKSYNVVELVCRAPFSLMGKFACLLSLCVVGEEQ